MRASRVGSYGAWNQFRQIPRLGTIPSWPRAALRFARRVHLGQHRKQTDEQFVEHPIEVARLLADAGYNGPIIAAAYLHDVVEKTVVEADEIRVRFGPEAAEVVEALTEDPTVIGYAERKRRLRAQVLAAGGAPVLIYTADRVANLRDWRTVPPERRELIAQRLDTTLDERLRALARGPGGADPV